MRLHIEIRRLVGDMVDKCNNKSFVSWLLGVDRSTVIRWARRRVQLKDRSQIVEEEFV